METLSAFLIELFWLSVDLKKKKHSSALKRNAESLAVDWGSLRKSLHPVLSREICFLSTKRQKKKCCFQHLWTFCLIYRVFFKTCTRQKQRQGSWKLDLNTKKKKKVSKAICDALCPRIPKGRDRIQDRLLENPVSVDRFSTKKWKHTDFYT